MNAAKDIPSLEKEIKLVKEKLDSMVDTEIMISEKVLEVSRELDKLIVGYYNATGQNEIFRL